MNRRLPLKVRRAIYYTICSIIVFGITFLAIGYVFVLCKGCFIHMGYISESTLFGIMMGIFPAISIFICGIDSMIDAVNIVHKSSKRSRK